jgi:hypothetical protein
MVIVEGIRGLCVILICFALTFQLAEYSLVSNYEYFDALKKDLLFNELVAVGSYNAVEIFFVLSGMS